MKRWQIEYWNPGRAKSPIEKWIDKLTKKQMLSVMDEINLLRQVGNELQMPHSKPLSKGLFELREKEFGFRIYYCFHGKKIIILLTAGNKQSQTRDIKIARERLSQLK